MDGRRCQSGLCSTFLIFLLQIILMTAKGQSSQFQKLYSILIMEYLINNPSYKTKQTIINSDALQQLSHITSKQGQLRNEHYRLLEDKIKLINGQSFKIMKVGDLQAAIDLLKEGEKILEYAAESCQMIGRELILTTLHNIACLSQMMWDFASCSDYLEGLIYNIEISLHSICQSKISIADTPKIVPVNNEQLITQRKIILYHLQYCAINSQMQRHKNGIIAARKAVRLAQSVSLELAKQLGCHYKKASIDLPEYEQRQLLLNLILDHKHFCHFEKNTDKFNAAGYSFEFWKNQKIFNKKHPFANQFKLISIGNIMTLSFASMDQNIPKPKLILQDSIVYHFLILSIAYFSLATQLRLIAQLQSNQDNLRQSQIYHLISIILAQIFIPFQTPYINHIRQNYFTNHEPLKTYSLGANPCYKEFITLLKKDCQGHESSINLHHESIATEEQSRRKYNNLISQNLKLKNICLAQNISSKNYKIYNKISHRSLDKKGKSFSINTDKIKRLSTDCKYSKNKSKQKTNQTAELGISHQHYYNTPKKAKAGHAKPNFSKKQPKQQPQSVKMIKRNDEIEDKYFNLALSNHYKSPISKKKQSDSLHSSNSTKDKSSKNSKLLKKVERDSKQKTWRVSSKKKFKC